MGILDQLARYGGVAAVDQAQHPYNGAGMRGDMPWNDPFAAFRQVAEEEMKKRMLLQQGMAQQQAPKALPFGLMK